MQFKAGYIIDEIFNLYREKINIDNFNKAIKVFDELCVFNIAGLENFELKEFNNNPNKIFYVLYNLIKRKRLCI